MIFTPLTQEFKLTGVNLLKFNFSSCSDEEISVFLISKIPQIMSNCYVCVSISSATGLDECCFPFLHKFYQLHYFVDFP